MKSGNIVLVENFEFIDWDLNIKGYERKCIVLFDAGDKVCLCPIVSDVLAFNNNSNNYYFLPFTNKKGKKLTFAKLNSIVLLEKDRVVETEFYLDNANMIRLINKVKNNYLNYKINENYEEYISKTEESICVK